MPRPRLTMRKIHELLRLRFAHNLTHREIAESLKVAPSTVGEHLDRFRASGLPWPLPDDLSDEELENRLFPPSPSPDAARPLPDWPWVHRELRRKRVTLNLLWQEYKSVHPDGFQYSWFCESYRKWAQLLDLPMRQDHKAGEKTFVDYAGQTVPIRDPQTGQTREAELFIAVLGASSYTFAEATWTQSLPDWIDSHVRAFEFFGGVTEIVVPDNLKSGVKCPHLYEPDINPTYQEWARHYGVAVIPARSRHPKDKAKAEAGVLLVERWILARLRNRTFFSLAELNRAIAELLVELNDKPFQKLPGSRRSQYEEVDRPVLSPLPSERYEYAEWKKARVHIDYHVEAGGHYYSVPHTLVKQEVEVRMTLRIVEIFHRRRRVASHTRSLRRGRHTTIREHMPKAHREYAEWTPERLIRWAAQSGPATATLVKTILESRPHPQQGFRSCLGIMRLGKSYGPQRLEAACQRALTLGSCSYKSVESILRTKLDSRPLPEPVPKPPSIRHGNVRGPDYYN